MRIVSLVFAMAALSGAAFAQEVSSAGRTSRPIAPEADPVNQIAERSTRPALVIALAFDGDEVALGQVIGARAPIVQAAPGEAEVVTIVGRLGERRISSVTVAHPTLAYVENGGVVHLRRTNVYAALPLPTAIDAIEVTDNTTRRTTRFSVAEQLREICRTAPAEPACRDVSPR